MNSPGLHLRPFRGAPDFELMAPLCNVCFAADGLDLFRTPEEMARDFANLQHFDPQRDLLMVEAAGELVAYARCWWFWQYDGTLVLSGACVVAPQWRGRGLGQALLGWLERRQARIAREQPEASALTRQAYVSEGERDRARLLQAAGYAPVRYFLTMLRPDLEGIPQVRLPDGVEVRTVLPEHHRAIWDAHTEAMRDHWGFAPPRPGDYEAWLRGKFFQPHLWQVAWDVQHGTVAGQVKPYIDPVYNRAFGKQRGWTEFISVAPQWRRRGLARALITRALQAQRSLGMTESALGVDSGNAHGASRVYEDCGFRPVQRATVYRKPMVLD